MILPSKELLSAVLGKDIVNMKMSEGAPSVLLYNYQYSFGMDLHKQGKSGKIKIYELMYMMKEWAFDNGYSLEVFKSADKCYEVVPKQYDEFLEEWMSYPYHIGETEPEAVTKACEWILEQIK